MDLQLRFRLWLELVSPGEPEKEQPNHATMRGMPVYGGEPLPGNETVIDDPMLQAILQKRMKKKCCKCRK